MSHTFEQYDFLTDVHRLIAWGYHDSSVCSGSPALEREITHEIRVAIQNRLEDIATPSRFDIYAVHEDDPYTVENGFLYIDLVFQRRERPKSSLFACEAKRLNSTSHPASVYCGKGGLRCFIDDGGKYARDCTEAGMLGYVQTNDIPYWQKQIETRFAEDAELNITVGLSEISVLKDRNGRV